MLIQDQTSRILLARKVATIDANNTTASVVVFTVTGSVLIHGIWGVVTGATDLTNHTKGHLRTNDQTATIDLTEATTGIALSGLAVGTLISKTALVAVALTLDDNAAAKITEPASAGQGLLSSFIVVKKTVAVTTVDYRYTTTDAPADAEITFGALWEPLSTDGNLV